MGQRLFVAIGEEGAQPQPDLRRGVDERIADHQLSPFVDPQQLLLEGDAAYAIGNRRRRSVAEIGNVFVPARFIDSAVAVDGQIERLALLDDRFIERREQHAGPVAVADGRYHQTVIPPGIAADDRCAHVSASAVGGEHLALQRILQVAQFVFVESKCRHVYVGIIWSSSL